MVEVMLMLKTYDRGSRKERDLPHPHLDNLNLNTGQDVLPVIQPTASKQCI